MWYVVDILFAQPPHDDTKVVQCESCNVLFEGATAREVYAKAQAWAVEHERDNNYRFAGIQHLWSLQEPRPGEGDEIGGVFFEEEDFWDRLDEFIPKDKNIPVIQLEDHPDTPVREFLSESQLDMLRKVFGEEHPERDDMAADA
jgi:hypothetical protein